MSCGVKLCMHAEVLQSAYQSASNLHGGGKVEKNKNQKGCNVPLFFQNSWSVLGGVTGI